MRTPAKPVSVADLKAHLRIRHDDEDALIESLLDAATSWIETELGLALCEQGWRLSLDMLPYAIDIPLGPVSAITAITYVDLDGQTQTLDPDLYDVDYDTKPVTIFRAYGQTWPRTAPRPGAVKVSFTAGFEMVPMAIVHAIKLLVGEWYLNRENSGPDKLSPISVHVQALIANWRLPGIV